MARRRVYAPELQSLLGCSDTWLGKLEKRGAIPPARIDPGGRRKWWWSDELDATRDSPPEAAPPRTPYRSARTAA